MIMDGSDTIDFRHLAMVQVRDWEFRKGAVRGYQSTKITKITKVPKYQSTKVPKVPKYQKYPITVEKQ